MYKVKNKNPLPSEEAEERQMIVACAAYSGILLTLQTGQNSTNCYM
jgi:hypothetical protein